METTTLTLCRYCSADLGSSRYQFCNLCSTTLIKKSFIAWNKSEYPEILEFDAVAMRCSDCKEFSAIYRMIDGGGIAMSQCCSAEVLKDAN